MKSPLIAMALAVSLAACASTPPVPDERDLAKLALYRAHAVEEVGSIPFSGSVDRWTGLGDRALAVWTSPARAWLLELTARCPDLEHSYGIAFDSRDNRIDAGFDSVIPLSPPANPRIPCQIASIHRIDVEALRAAERAQDSGL